MIISGGKKSRRIVNSLVSIAFASLALVGCGDDSSSPEAVTIEDLKYPGALTITDNGAGAIQLAWSGSNNEDDFDGYNVYGMKATSDNGIADKEGQAIILLDTEGEPVQEARDYLAKFNFGEATGYNEKAASVDEDGESLFSALPVHTLDGEEKMLPTCKINDTSNACEATTADNLGTNDRLNGVTTFDINSLTVGDTYCFLILSSIDQGTKVSMTSSNVACVTPKYTANVSQTLPTAAAENVGFDLRTILTACGAATDGDCGDTSTAFEVDGVFHYGQAPMPIYVEFGGDFVAGKNAAIVDLGVYAGGFSDALLPKTAPALTLGSDSYDPKGNADRKTNIINAGGYSIGGQSIPILENHMYVFAVGAADADGPSDFHYHWLWVEGDPSTTLTAKMRLSKGVNER